MTESVVTVVAVAEGAFKSSEMATVTLSIPLSEWWDVTEAMESGRPVRFEVAAIPESKVLDVDMGQAFLPSRLASDVIARGGIVTLVGGR